MKSLPHPCAEENQVLHSIGRQEGIANNLLRSLADSVHAPGSLHESDNGPREIEIDDDCTILEVLPLAQYVRRDQDSKFLIDADAVPLVVTGRTEAPGVARGVLRLACYASQALDPTRAKLCLQVPHGVGKLRKDDDLLIRMVFREQFVQGIELCVLLWLPSPAAFQHAKQARGIGSKIRRQRLHEQIGAQPLEAAPEMRRVSLVRLGSPCLQVVHRGPIDGRRGARSDVVALEKLSSRRLVIHILVVITGIEKTGILCA